MDTHSDKTERAPRKPRSLTVIGSASFAVGTLGGVVTGFNAWHRASATWQAVAGERIGPQAFMDAWHTVVLGAGFFGCVLLAWAGWGIARQRRWGRVAAMVFGVYGVALGIGLAWIGLTRMAPMLITMEVESLPGNVPESPGHAVRMAAVWILIPMAMLFWTLRPRTAQWFRKANK